MFGTSGRRALSLHTFGAGTRVCKRVRCGCIHGRGKVCAVYANALSGNNVSRSPSSFERVGMSNGSGVAARLQCAFVRPRVTVISPVGGRVSTTAKSQLPISIGACRTRTGASRISCVLDSVRGGRRVTGNGLVSLAS